MLHHGLACEVEVEVEDEDEDEDQGVACQTERFFELAVVAIARQLPYLT